MARKFIKNIVFIFVFILFNIFISYGEYSVFGVEGLVNNLDNSINNIHFIELGDKEIGVNKHTNEVILGWSYDENGDLVYSDPSALKSYGFKSMIMDYNYFLDTYELVYYVILDEYK